MYTLLKTFAIVLISSITVVAYANEPVYQTRAGIAINGYDTVAYFTEDQPVKGKRQFSHEYQGATWLFSSAENRDLFAADPEAYAPAYNGFCAFAMGTYSGTTRTQPDAYTIKDGRLYLNFNQNVGERFRADIDNLIAEGGDNWETVVSYSLAEVEEPVFKNGRNIAIRGFDTVAYFTQGEAVKGDPNFSHQYKGATWLFSSREHRNLFTADPERYAPAYNGFCAYALGENGKLVRVNPRVWTIKDDRLYLNFSRRIGQRFEEDIDRYIEVGEENWEETINLQATES